MAERLGPDAGLPVERAARVKSAQAVRSVRSLSHTISSSANVQDGVGRSQWEVIKNKAKKREQKQF